MSRSVAVKLTVVAVVALVAAGCSNTQRRTGTGAAWGAGIGAVAGGAIGAATAN